MTGLEHMLAEAAPWLHRYGYGALAAAVLLEGMGIPAPGEILLAGAALLAGRGEMSLPAVLLSAWAAAVAGDNLGYCVGRAGGRRLLLRAGVSRHRLVRFDRFFRRFGVWLILFGRFFDGTRQLDGLVAGSARMPWPRFLLADLAGVSLWVLVWVIGLYTADRHGAALHRWLIQINPWVAALALASLATTLLLLFLRRSGPRDGALHLSGTAARIPPCPPGRRGWDGRRDQLRRSS
ncbi:MAG: DedA family protein [Chromatiales bacterium]